MSDQQNQDIENQVAIITDTPVATEMSVEDRVIKKMFEDMFAPSVTVVGLPGGDKRTRSDGLTFEQTLTPEELDWYNGRVGEILRRPARQRAFEALYYNRPEA